MIWWHRYVCLFIFCHEIVVNRGFSRCFSWIQKKQFCFRQLSEATYQASSNCFCLRHLHDLPHPDVNRPLLVSLLWPVSHSWCALALQGNACKQYVDCGGKGLHCHHPRDCLYHLRDENIEHLQKLLAVSMAYLQLVCVSHCPNGLQCLWNACTDVCPDHRTVT